MWLWRELDTPEEYGNPQVGAVLSKLRDLHTIDVTGAIVRLTLHKRIKYCELVLGS